MIPGARETPPASKSPECHPPLTPLFAQQRHRGHTDIPQPRLALGAVDRQPRRQYVDVAQRRCSNREIAIKHAVRRRVSAMPVSPEIA